jgi:hypothetical protein
MRAAHVHEEREDYVPPNDAEAEQNDGPPPRSASETRERDARAILSCRIVAVEASWLTEPPPSREYLANDTRTNRGALGARGVALLVAAGGAGKSYASVALAVAVASGTPWLGAFAPCRPGRVLIVSAEEPADEVRRRVYYIAKSAGVTSPEALPIDVLDVHDLHVPLLDATGCPSNYASAIVEIALERGSYALTIVDPLARVAGAPIDVDNVAAGALVAALEAISSAAGGLVLGVHHTDKAARRQGIVDATAVRGASGLGDSARMVMVLSVENLKHDDPLVTARLGEVVLIRCVKANHVRTWEAIELRRGEYGELLPLDAADRSMVNAARRAADPTAARREERKADREARAAEAQANRNRRAAEDADRTAQEDAAARAILEKLGPKVTCRVWYAEMKATLGSCSKERADAAGVRVGR